MSHNYFDPIQTKKSRCILFCLTGSLNQCWQCWYFKKQYLLSILSLVKSFLNPDVYYLTIATGFPACPHSWWKEDKEEEIGGCLTGPTNNQRTRRTGWKIRDRWHNPTAICQLVSNPQPSHLLRTLSAWKFTSYYFVVQLLFCHCISFHCFFSLFLSLFILTFFLFYCHSSLHPSLPSSPTQLTLYNSSDMTLPQAFAHHYPVFLSLSVSLTLHLCFHLPDVIEGKETDSASLIGQRRQRPQPWLTVLSGDYNLTIHV